MSDYNLTQNAREKAKYFMLAISNEFCQQFLTVRYYFDWYSIPFLCEINSEFEMVI